MVRRTFELPAMSSVLSSRLITAVLALVFFLPLTWHARNHFGVLEGVSNTAFLSAAALVIAVILCCFQSEREAKHHRD